MGRFIDVDQIFSVKEQHFNELSIDIFRHQSINNNCYRDYLNLIGCDPNHISHYTQIPFLPIEFFKSREIKTSDWQLVPDQYFESSGTTSSINSKHYFKDLTIYDRSAKSAFEGIFGPLENYEILALLPHYLERGHSSLVYMVKQFMKYSRNERETFYLDQFQTLDAHLKENEKKNIPTILIGVSFALLDFINEFPQDLKTTLVMETGGMKGRKTEMTRTDLHQQLKEGFGIENVLSEYGMTELFSQAYSKSEGRFHLPPWSRVLIREQEDPFSYVREGKSGGINIVDLANVDSCSFIATSDLGKVHPDNTFEVLGRFDHSDIRGCSMLV